MLAYVIGGGKDLSRKINIFFFSVFLEVIYQSKKMTHWESCVICKTNQCFTSFHTYKAQCNKNVGGDQKMN